MALLLDVAIVAFLCAAMLSINRILGPNSTHAPEKDLPYETGMPPMDVAVSKMTVPYVRFALLFVVFDVELAFLLPAATLRGRLDASVMTSLTLFLALLAVMLGYLWKKGALHCD